MKAILSWLNDRKWLILFGAVLAIVFFALPHYAELVYSAFKLTLVVTIASMIVHWLFPGTIHKYLFEDQFVQDFHDADPKQKLWMTVSALGIILIVAALCFFSA